MTVQIEAKRYIGFLKGECVCYYNVLFARKAAPPLCILLCCLTIASYMLTQM